MANLSIRRGEPREALASGWDPLRTFDPFRMIRDMMSADPFAGLASPTSAMFAPDVEIKETKDAYVFKADLPGVRDEDLEVSVTGNRLTVSGKRQEEQRQEDDRYFVYERAYGTFARSFVLPESADVERVKAELKNGVLLVSVPKRAEMQPRRIEVGSSKEQEAKEPIKTEPQAKGDPSPKKAA